MSSRGSPPWDLFLAHAGPDLPVAKDLAALLTNDYQLSCFLDARKLEPGHAWPTRLKEAIVSSSVIVVLVSEHSDKAFYLQEEVAIAIHLYREAPDSIRVVPVLRRHAKREHLPYGTFALHALHEDERGWPPIAAAINGIVTTLRETRAMSSLARSVHLLDELWTGIEPALTDRGNRVPAEYRLRFMTEGDDLIARHRVGGELQRVSRVELDKRLSAEDLDYLHLLERSMEVNRAVWEAKYPNRVLDKRSKRAAEEAADALAEDLGGVLDLMERSGLWLDDHYQVVRNIAADRRRGAPR
jgi:hypothetical protein